MFDWESQCLVDRKNLIRRLLKALPREKHSVREREFLAGPLAELDLLDDEVGTFGGEIFAKAGNERRGDNARLVAQKIKPGSGVN